MVSYRRMGHNELDEPAYTQPVMYKKIRGLSSVPNNYARKLAEENIISKDQKQIFRDNYYNQLEKSLERASSYQPPVLCFLYSSSLLKRNGQK